MNPDKPLAGQVVLVTRPSHQAEGLCRRIESAGGTALRFPVLEIAPVTDPAAARTQLQQLDRFDFAVFVSANAVEQALALLAPEALPGPPRLAAIGQATAAALRKAGYPDVIQPEHRFDSEGLLETDAFREVSGRSVAIVRGEGGREWLSQQLRAAGAHVTPVEIYRRRQPRDPDDTLHNALEHGTLTLLTVSSGNGLENLLTLAGPKARRKLVELPLVVPSARTREGALKHGFHGPVAVAANAGDEAVVEALAQLAAQR